MILSFFCFLRHALVPRDVVEVVMSHDLGISFERAQSAASGGQEVPFSEQALGRLRELDTGTMHVEGSNGSLRLASVSSLAADLIILRSPVLPSTELVEAVAAIPGFASGLSGDADDVFLQSTRSPQHYRMHGKAWEHLPRTPHPLGKEPYIDVSQHAGRHSRGPGMWMWAAARMRFGAGAFLVLDRERLLASPVGDVAELSDGTVQVRLYELDDDESLMRERQREFRAWMGFDDIEARSKELIPPKQPAMDFDRSGSDFPGGVLITEWLHDETLVYPSGANQQRKTQYDKARTVIWQDVTDLPVSNEPTKDS